MTKLVTVLDDYEVERLRALLATVDRRSGDAAGADGIWLLQMINRRLERLLPDKEEVWLLMQWLSWATIGGSVLPSDYPPPKVRQRLLREAGIRGAFA